MKPDRDLAERLRSRAGAGLAMLAATLLTGFLLGGFSVKYDGEALRWLGIGLLSGIVAFLVLAFCLFVHWGISVRFMKPTNTARHSDVGSFFSRLGLLFAAATVVVLAIALPSGMGFFGLLKFLAPMLLVGAVAWTWFRGGWTVLPMWVGAAIFFGGLGVLRALLGANTGTGAVYRFASPSPKDMVLLNWNIGCGFPGFSASQEEDLARVAATIRETQARVVCLQEVASDAHLKTILDKLGGAWKGRRSGGRVRGTAILHRLHGSFDFPSPRDPFGGPTLFSFDNHGKVIQFVSFHNPGGSRSELRRRAVNAIHHRCVSKDKLAVLAGDFSFCPERGWTVLGPLLSSSRSADYGSWEIAKLIGPDVGEGGAGTTALNRRTDWVIVDRRIPVSGYQVLRGKKSDCMDHDPEVVRLQL